MTVALEPEASPPEAPPDAPEKSRWTLGTPLTVGLRLAVILGLAAFAFADSLAALRVEIAAHTLITYVPPTVVLLIIAILGVTLRHDFERPIYDRDTDFIVGIVVLILSLSFEGLLNRRFLVGYLVTRIDILAFLLFLFGGCVLAFGLRPTMRYRWVWGLSISLFPLPYRMVVVALGTSRVAAGVAMVLLAAIAVAIAVGRTRRRATVGAIATLAFGGLLLLTVHMLAPTAPISVYQWVPAVGVALAVCLYFYLAQRREAQTLRPFPNRDIRPLTAPSVRLGLTIIAVAAVALHFIGAPTIRPTPGPTIPGLQAQPPLVIPPGWRQVEASPVQPSPVNGVNGVRQRQVLIQNTGEARFDVHARPRRVVVDTVATRTPLTLDIYITPLVYNISGSRTSPLIEVPLPHGVVGSLQTIVDDVDVLTYNKLTWRWNNGIETQQVTLFSVDNHEANAPFPQYRRQRETWEILSGMLTLLFRGNAVTEDLNPRFKDRDLLTETAAAIINAQVAAIEAGHE